MINNGMNYPGGFGHGTMCLSQIFATHNGIGIAGTTPNALPYVMGWRLGSQGAPDLTHVYANWMWAVDELHPGGKMILTNSWASGGPYAPGSWPDTINNNGCGWPTAQDIAEYHPTGQEVTGIANDATTWVKQHGGLILAAAGNDGTDLTYFSFYPGEADDMICVAAYGPEGRKIFYSNWGDKIDAIAPTNVGACCRADMYVTSYGSGLVRWDSDKYWSGTGTSTATPVTAGVLALIWSANTTLTNLQVEAILYRTVSPFFDLIDEAVHFPGPNRRGYRRGVINAGKAATMAAASAASGTVLPYLGFFCKDYIAITSINNTEGTYRTFGTPNVSYSKDANGVITQTLRGEIAVEITGYTSSGSYESLAEADLVELWIGPQLVYSGPPGCFHAVASYDGVTARPVRVRTTIGGIAAEETYTDIAVTSLALGAIVNGTRVLASVTVHPKSDGAGGVYVEGAVPYPVAVKRSDRVPVSPTTYNPHVPAYDRTKFGAPGLAAYVDGETPRIWRYAITGVDIVTALEPSSLPAEGEFSAFYDGTKLVYVDSSGDTLVEIPGSLPVYWATTDGVVSGSDVVLDAGEYVEWNVSAGLGGTFKINANAASSGSGVVDLYVDNEAEPRGTAAYPGAISITVTLTAGIHTLSLRESGI